MRRPPEPRSQAKAMPGGIKERKSYYAHELTLPSAISATAKMRGPGSAAPGSRKRQRILNNVNWRRNSPRRASLPTKPLFLRAAGGRRELAVRCADYLLYESGAARPWDLLIILNCPSLRISPTNTGFHVCWFLGSIFFFPPGEVDSSP